MFLSSGRREAIAAKTEKSRLLRYFTTRANLLFFYGIFLFLYEFKHLRNAVGFLHLPLLAWAAALVGYDFLVRGAWRKLPGWPWGALFAAATVLTGISTREAGLVGNLKAVVMTCLPLILFLPLCLESRGEERERQLLKALSGAMVLYALGALAALVMYLLQISRVVTFLGKTGIMGFRYYQPDDPTSGILLYGFFEDTNHSAAYALCFAAFGLWMANAGKRQLFHRAWVNRAGRIFGVTSAVLQLCYFPLANSRGGWLALVVAGAAAVFCFMFFTKLRDKRFGKRMGMSLSVCVLSVTLVCGILLGGRTILAGVSSVVGTGNADIVGVVDLDGEKEDKTGIGRFDKKETVAGSGRLEIWGDTLELFGHRPILGCGTENRVYFAKQYGYENNMTRGRAVHNSFLELLVGYGILGTVLLTAFLACGLLAGLKQMVRRGERWNGTQYAALFCFLLTGGASLLLSCTFINVTAMYFLMLLSLSYLLPEPEANRVSGLRKFLAFGRRHAVRLWMLLWRVRPLERKVVVINYYGRGWGDNGKAIVESLRKQAPDLRILWAVKPGQEASLPTGVEPVGFRSLQYYRQLATAKVWVDNSRQEAGLWKRKNQYYIQAWHGPISFKKIEKDVEDKLSEGYVLDAKHDSKMADLILSGSTFFTELCRRTFWYDGEILECGTPRLDAIFHPTADPVAVRKALGIPEGKRIALYAPTFRADYSTDCYRLDFEAVLHRLEELTGDSWVMGVRLHPNVASKADFIAYSDRVVNTTVYADLYEFLPMVDLLISDYSSCSFEAGMIGKPVAIFATDVAAYKQDRDLYFDFDKLPFPFCQSNEELLQKLETVWTEQYRRDLDAFNKSLGLCENGTASETVANRILEVLDHGK